MEIKKYPCGEFYNNGIFENETIYYCASITNNDDLIALLIILDTLNYQGVKVNLILNYIYYARCDKAINNCPITAKMIFSLLPSYIKSIITINLHNPATIGYFKSPAKNISYNELWKDKIKSIITENSVLVAPDFGSGKEIIKLSEELNVPYAIGLKQRTSTDNKLVNFIGDVKDKDCIICDDIVDTGKTLSNIIKKLRENGAKSIVGCITHAVLSSTEVIPMFDQLYLGNTIDFEKKTEEFKQIEIMELAL